MGSLRVSDRQKVEILRALARHAQLIVMDEPTAALPSEDAKVFLETVRALRDRGITILYISHYLQEVLAVSDSVSILRDGHLIRTASAADETPESLVAAMLGRPGDLAFPTKTFPPETAPVVLSVRGLARPPGVNGVDFEVREGEIVGLAGLIGSGRTEIARAITGADRPTAGEIRLGGELLDLRSPRDAIDRGIALLPESRKDQGLFLRLPVRDNITLSHLADLTSFGILRPGREKAEATKSVDRLAVKPASLKSKVATLSGGNQQKVLFARSLFLRPRVLVVDEPTRGVDVGAKRSIYELIVALAEEGLGVVLISSELEEVIGLAHRVLVVREGRIVKELIGDAIEEEAVLQAAFATRPVNHHARRWKRCRPAPSSLHRSTTLSPRRRRISALRDYGIVFSFVALFAALAFSTDAFLTPRNLFNILDQQAAIGIIACFGTLVLIAGGLDLSTGAVFAFSGIVAAETVGTLPVWGGNGVGGRGCSDPGNLERAAGHGRPHQRHHRHPGHRHHDPGSGDSDHRRIAGTGGRTRLCDFGARQLLGDQVLGLDVCRGRPHHRFPASGDNIRPIHPCRRWQPGGRPPGGSTSRFGPIRHFCSQRIGRRALGDPGQLEGGDRSGRRRGGLGDLGHCRDRDRRNQHPGR